MNKNILMVLVFLLALVGLFSVISIERVDVIGDFFEKIITPISVPLSVLLFTKLGYNKYKQIKNKDDL